jgi:hypothetical protein
MGSCVLKQLMLAESNGFTLNKRKHLIENLNSRFMFILEHTNQVVLGFQQLLIKVQWLINEIGPSIQVIFTEHTYIS